MQFPRRMKLTSLAVFVIAGGIALFILEGDESDSDTGARTASASERLFALGEEDVESVSFTSSPVENGEQRELVIDRDADDEHPWRMAGGYESDWPVDTSRRDRLVSRVLSVRPRRVITERGAGQGITDADVADFGFDSPDRTIVVRGAHGRSETLHIGREASGGGRYVLVESADRSAIAIVRDSALEHLRTSPLDLRERRLLDFDAGKIALAEYGEAGDEAHWRIESRGRVDDERLVADYRDPALVLTRPFPAAYGLDTGALGDLLDALPAFRVERFVDDSPEDLSDYGLEHRQAERLYIRLEAGHGGETAASDEAGMVLYLGDRDGSSGARRFARLEGREPVFTLGYKGGLDEFDGFRLADKFALLVAVDSVESLAVTCGDERRRITAGEDGQIYYIEDEHDAQPQHGPLGEAAGIATGNGTATGNGESPAEGSEARSVSRSEFLAAFTELIRIRAESATRDETDNVPSVADATIHLQYLLRDGGEARMWLVPTGGDYRIIRPVERELGAPFIVSSRSIERALTPLWEL